MRPQLVKKDRQWNDLVADVEGLLQARADRWDRFEGDTTDERFGGKRRTLKENGFALLALAASLK